SSSHRCKIASREITKIINVPVMAASETGGIAGCLYNATIPNIDNWRRFTQLPGAADGIPDLYRDERIGPKIILNIMDGLIAQYAAGPSIDPNYGFPFGPSYGGRAQVR